jgi:hypothetical protein
MKSWIVVLIVGLYGWQIPDSSTGAQGEGGLPAQEARGKQIYLKGASDGGEIQ